MKNFIKASLLLSATSLITTSALAQSNTEPNFYGGLSYERIDVNLGSGLKFDSLILRGGARFSKYFGAEAEFGTGFKNDSLRVFTSPTVFTDVKFKSGITAGAYAVGFLPLAENFDLVGRAGYKRIGFKAKTPGADISDNAAGFAWSVGAQYYFSDSPNGVRFDYSQASGGDVKTITVGYQRRF